MLEYFYKERRTLVHFRRGPLGSLFDGFAAHLKRQGYSLRHASQILGQCCQFNDFLIDHAIALGPKIKASVEPFVKVYVADFRTTGQYSAERTVRLALRHLFNYLVEVGAIKREEPKPPRKPYSWMLEPYLKFLRQERRLTETRVQTIRKVLCAFLEGLGKRVMPKAMKSLTAAVIEGYVKQHLKESPENLLRLVGALRGFLHFCAQQRYTACDLSGVIPSVPRYRLASLPKGMEDAAIQRVLEAVPQDTAFGCRDYAILMLLTAYGLRAQQIANLRLDDINWPRSLIRIGACKGGKEVVLPLLEAVGEALLRYLRHRPADSPFRHLFLSPRAPHPPATVLVISQLVRAYMKKAGVQAPVLGAKTLRHSWAIRTLTHGASIKAIADMLGHRWINNTFIYAKADLKTLREVALPWPEVQP